jgi:SnoaL-like domain
MPESDPLQWLLDIEAIKQLKGKYFLFMDTKQWDAWGELFTEDVRVEGTKQATDADRATFVAGVSSSLADVQTAHHGHTPIIELTSETTARGVWAMFDDLRFPEGHAWSEGFARRVGYGHYEEEYRKDGETWRISFMRLARLWVWRHHDPGPIVEGGIPSAGRQWLEHAHARS